MTTLAMGRLQLTIAVEPREKARPAKPTNPEEIDAIEAAKNLEQRFEEVECDRSRWTTGRMLGM